MGKVRTALGTVALLLAALSPQPLRPTHAQSPATCTAGVLSSPMQGHYTGPWHSDGDYHFSVFNTDLDLKIIIDGTVDLTVGADGKVAGSVNGKVDAPITDYGRQDISSGIGTISGGVTGAFSSGGSLLVLAQPVIDMHWGTFGGGHSVERYITMPDYQFPVDAFDCISAHGSISEQNFPEQAIVADGAGQMTYATGIGTAAGTWQATSDSAAAYADLSTQVDSFITSANTVLTDSSQLTPGIVQDKVVDPLKTLEDRIRQSPSVARCLLERLQSWEASTVAALYARALTSATGADLPGLRRAGDLLRVARSLNLDCSVPDGGVSATLTSNERFLLDRAVASRNWSDAVALWRELVLIQGDAGRQNLQGELSHDLDLLAASTSSSRQLLDLARISYALDDQATAQTAVKKLPAHLAATAGSSTSQCRAAAVGAGSCRARPVLATQHRSWSPDGMHTDAKKKKPRPKPKPTATPVPPTLLQVLTANAPHIAVSVSGQSIAWSPVSGAARYLVTVGPEGGPLAWATVTGSTHVIYGDVTVDGVANSSADGWPVAFPAGTIPSIVALDASGQVVALTLR